MPPIHSLTAFERFEGQDDKPVADEEDVEIDSTPEGKEEESAEVGDDGFIWS